MSAARVFGLVAALAALAPAGFAAGAAENPASPALQFSAPAPAGNASGCRAGYRREGVIRDFALGSAWLVLVSCAHPAWPRVAVPLDGDTPREIPALRRASAPAVRLLAERAERAGLAAAVSAPVPVVPSGSRVRLWRQDRIARVDLFGIALESGAPGAAVRVRLLPGGKVLRGTVRGAGSVELDIGGDGGFGRPGQ